jgi:hypothetical protein
VRKKLDRICGFSVFVDLDLSSAFHQLRLGPITSDRLSLVTLWGQVRPVFLAEAVTPASSILQEIVSSYMVRADFPWSRRPWDKDYEAIFVGFKQALLSACELFYPNYELDWVLRVDASDRGVGAVLFQVAFSADGLPVHQPLVFASQKLSDIAQRWTVFEKEAYAMYFGILSVEHYLRAKPFTLETDHNNLVWMEASLVPKVIRWRIFMQGFRFLVNAVADWQSRFYNLTSLPFSRQKALESSHIGRAGL